MTKTAFDSRYLNDKIVGVFEGSYSASTYNTVLGGYLYQKNIPHSFGRPVFCDALFSDDNVHFVPNGNVTNDTLMSLQVYSDSSNIYILSTANTGTIYYKIICTWINNYDNTNPSITPVLSSTAKTYFDSRYNYQKIFSHGVVTESNPGTGGGASYVTHNLSYLPNYKIYFESQVGQVWPAINGGAQDIWLYNSTQYEIEGKVGTNFLNFFYQPGTTSASTFRLWYIIYYDS